ncbi:MAG: enoyl-CoA hydratase-related protein [Thermoplasmatota archaeon]
MIYKTIKLTSHQGIATITLSRPDVHNAMNETLMKELTTSFQNLSEDTTVQCIVLTGEGPSFCAGADLNWMKSMVSYTKQENINDSNLLLDLYNTINDCPKPVIGKINGHAFGGGLGLIAVCDITIATPKSKFAFSEAKLGIIPAVISSFVSPRMKQADMRRFFITAERFDTQIAHEIGLIDIVTTEEEFEQTIEKYISLVLSSGPQAITEIKKLINNLSAMDRKQFQQHSVEKIAELRVSMEGQEGISAFLEKRKPHWRMK